MVMTVDKIALARRLVACPHFLWLPGMLDFEGDRVRLAGTEDGPVWYSHCVGPVPGRTHVDGDPLPDLDDPATLGCIEHGLLPAAWGRGHIQTHWTSEGDGSVYIHNADGAEVWCIEMVPKAEALVAALEAAP